MFVLRESGLPMLSKVFLPMMIGCPRVILWNRLRSDGRSQGILLFRPITRFSAMAAMMEMIMVLPALCGPDYAIKPYFMRLFNKNNYQVLAGDR
jgi:hypothetical protein